MIEKIIKICSKICAGNIKINDLWSKKHCFYLNNNELQVLLITCDTNDYCKISTRKGVLFIPLSEVDKAKLVVALNDVFEYSQVLAKECLDDLLNTETFKNNITDLDF